MPDISVLIPLSDGFEVQIDLNDHGDRIDEPGRWWKFQVYIRSYGTLLKTMTGPTSGYLSSRQSAEREAARVAAQELRNRQINCSESEIRKYMKGK